MCIEYKSMESGESRGRGERMKAIRWVDKDITVSAEKFPDRKRPAICITKGNFITVYGYFSNDIDADLFIKELAKLVGAQQEELQ